MKFHLIILFSIITFLFFLSPSQSKAELIWSVNNGNWNTATTWLDESGDVRVPANGDEILIDPGYTVTIPAFTIITLNNVSIEIRGVLSIPFLGSLTLDANSLVVIDSSGSISGFWSQVKVGGETIPLIGTPITGPQFIDSSVGLQSGTPPGYVPLPINLLSFSAKLMGEVIEIAWATASETENDYFTLERSTDGENWEMIAEEPGAGNSDVHLDYNYTDSNPVPGLSYYRLKQTDYDGQFEYFTPAVVLYEPNNLFKVYPNPTSDRIELTTSSELDDAQITIKNLNGQAQPIDVSAAVHQANIDLTNLPAGVYLLELVFPESVLTKRIVKK